MVCIIPQGAKGVLFYFLRSWNIFNFLYLFHSVLNSSVGVSMHRILGAPDIILWRMLSGDGNVHSHIINYSQDLILSISYDPPST